MFRKRLRKASMQRWQERGFRHASSRAGNHTPAGGARRGACRDTCRIPDADGNARRPPPRPDGRHAGRIRPAVGNHSVRMWQSDVRESALSGLWVLQSFVSFMYFDNSKLCAITKTNIRPVKPNSLKLTQVAVGKLKATYTFSTPMTAKKPAQAWLSFSHTISGSAICLPIMLRIRFLPNANWLISSAAANTQYSTVGFHLMKFSSWKLMVAPPKMVMMSSETHSFGSTRLRRSSRKPNRPSEARSATAVASRIGACAAVT